MIRVTRQYRFSASHRLHTPALSEERNRAVFGKCANPYGHGHDYVLQVSARGPLNPTTGLCVNVERLDRLVEERVLRDVRTTDLNRLPDFSSRVATTENLAAAVRERLDRAWSSAFPDGPALDAVRIRETARNAVQLLPDHR
jgi:6-pyruvoyltetrahydropterin/6-carboxytetrahydropterin synthase